MLFPKQILPLSLLQVWVLNESYGICLFAFDMEFLHLSFIESEGDPAVDTDEGSIHSNRSW